MGFRNFDPSALLSDLQNQRGKVRKSETYDVQPNIISLRCTATFKKKLCYKWYCFLLLKCEVQDWKVMRSIPCGSATVDGF